MLDSSTGGSDPSRPYRLARWGSAILPTFGLAVACLAHILYASAASSGEMAGQTAMVYLMPLFALAGLAALTGLTLLVSMAASRGVRGKLGVYALVANWFLIIAISPLLAFFVVYLVRVSAQFNG